MLSSTPVRGDDELATARAASAKRLQAAWEDIFARYGAIAEEDDDVVDLRTETLLVDNGFVRNTPGRHFGELLGSVLGPGPESSPLGARKRRRDDDGSPLARRKAPAKRVHRAEGPAWGQDEFELLVGPRSGAQSSAPASQSGRKSPASSSAPSERREPSSEPRSGGGTDPGGPGVGSDGSEDIPDAEPGPDQAADSDCEHGSTELDAADSEGGNTDREEDDDGGADHDGNGADDEDCDRDDAVPSSVSSQSIPDTIGGTGATDTGATRRPPEPSEDDEDPLVSSGSQRSNVPENQEQLEDSSTSEEGSKEPASGVDQSREEEAGDVHDDPRQGEQARFAVPGSSTPSHSPGSDRRDTPTFSIRQPRSTTVPSSNVSTPGAKILVFRPGGGWESLN
ncbi:hypothetical protein DFJ74DRAFT_701392 [Hyaloraphidium curvatum]|nr:hypothetical protein DFJ74DRAFT_701392 [Hyaloraphidium curvatum]